MLCSVMLETMCFESQTGLYCISTEWVVISNLADPHPRHPPQAEPTLIEIYFITGPAHMYISMSSHKSNKIITNNKIFMINAQQSDLDWSVSLPKYLLGACFINDILSESLEKPGIFSLVDSSQDGGRGPTTRVDHWAIGNSATEHSSVGWLN